MTIQRRDAIHRRKLSYSPVLKSGCFPSLTFQNNSRWYKPHCGVLLLLMLGLFGSMMIIIMIIDGDPVFLSQLKLWKPVNLMLGKSRVNTDLSR
jgi:hypothetical protein